MIRRAASDIWAVVRNPKKALQLVGGDTAGNLIYPAILGVCLLAFHQHLDFAQLDVLWARAKSEEHAVEEPKAHQDHQETPQ